MLESLYINGKWQTGTEQELTSLNPTNSEILWQKKTAGKADIHACFKAAEQAFEPWSNMDFEQRARIIFSYRALVEKHKEAFAQLIAKESGKIYWDSLNEANSVIGKIDISIRSYQERTGKKAVLTDFGQLFLDHRPHGVLAVFGPYNFPAHLPNGHIIPALLAGNTIVFKPSEITPFVGEFMVSLWHQAGLPKGVLNLVQGGKEVGQHILSNPALSGVLFTGSAETGKHIHKQFAGRPEIILALEMGGNNPLIVWDVDDFDASANLIIQSAYISSGQRCSCTRRLLIGDNEAGEALIKTLLHKLDALEINDWDANPVPFMGPLASESSAERVLLGQKAILDQGGIPLREVKPFHSSACFLTPGLIDVSQSGFIDQEVFGPLLQFAKVSDFKTALKLANQTEFGLSAGLISENKSLWKEFKQKIRAGVINWNRPTTGASSALPFGGIGSSGNHRPSAYYASDYCAWPLAGQESPKLESIKSPGM